MEHETQSAPPEHHSRLLDVLTSLEEEIKKQNSLKHSLLRGMIYGLGTVIGATVLVALLGGIIASTIGDLKNTPFAGLVEQRAE